MSRRELEELAAELAPLQDARFEQRHFERRGGPRRQAKGKHGRLVFTSADRTLIAIVYLRQVLNPAPAKGTPLNNLESLFDAIELAKK